MSPIKQAVLATGFIISDICIPAFLFASGIRELEILGAALITALIIRAIRLLIPVLRNKNSDEICFDESGKEIKLPSETEGGLPIWILNFIMDVLLGIWAKSFIAWIMGSNKRGSSYLIERELDKALNSVLDDAEIEEHYIEKMEAEKKAEMQKHEEQVKSFVYKDDDAEMDSISVNGTIEPNIDDDDVEMDSIGNITSNDLAGSETETISSDDENNNNSNDKSDIYRIY